MKLLAKSIIAIFVLLRSCSPLGRGPNPLVGQLAPEL